jgi:hypothetical protein
VVWWNLAVQIVNNKQVRLDDFDIASIVDILWVVSKSFLWFSDYSLQLGDLPRSCTDAVQFKFCPLDYKSRLAMLNNGKTWKCICTFQIGLLTILLAILDKWILLFFLVVTVAENRPFKAPIEFTVRRSPGTWRLTKLSWQPCELDSQDIPDFFRRQLLLLYMAL